MAEATPPNLFPETNDTVLSILRKVLYLLMGQGGGAASMTTGGATRSSSVSLAANTNRRFAIIQNLNTAPLYVKLGSGASGTSFDFILQAATAELNGTSLPFRIENYAGEISFHSESSYLYTVSEA